MALKIRRGTNTERLAFTPELGELIYVTDYATAGVAPVWVGDGSTLGGVDAGSGAGGDIVTENDVKDIVGAMLENGTHTNLSFVYPGVAPGTIDATAVFNNLATNLDLATFDLIGTGNIDINGSIRAVDGILLRPLVDDSALIFDFLATTNPFIIPSVNFRSYGTSFDVELATRLNPGDYINGIQFSAFEPTDDSTTSIELNAASIISRIDNQGTIDATHASGKIELRTNGPASSIKFMTFDSSGRLAVNQQDATATVDINGVMRLVKQSNAPSPAVEGMIAVADGSSWNPVPGGSGSYPVYYNGTAWFKMI
jgi:hypothetical protein